MSRGTARYHAIVWGSCLALVLSGATARAADAPAAESTPAGESTDQRPIAVALHSDSADLTLDAVRAAVNEELNLRTVPADSKESFSSRGVLTITYRATSKELAISYSDVEHGVITRIVPAPDRIADVPGVAALVAGNLVRRSGAWVGKRTQCAKCVA